MSLDHESLADFSLRGGQHLEWGVKHRLSRIFDPRSGRTLMLAFDHGYFLGPTTGLERIDEDIVPLAPFADALMCTRGVLRANIPPTYRGGVVLRASGGPSILKELSNERIAVAMDDAVRLGVSAVAVQVFVGGEHEAQSIHNLTRLVDEGNRVGMPVLAVTAVGRDMERDAKYLRLATRMCAELGASIVKTYYCTDGFETVTGACPVPIVVAGGKKVAEMDALRMACESVRQGAAGVDMGRNIFQSEHPAAMINAVRKIVHETATAQESHEYYRHLASS